MSVHSRQWNEFFKSEVWHEITSKLADDARDIRLEASTVDPLDADGQRKILRSQGKAEALEQLSKRIQKHFLPPTED